MVGANDIGEFVGCDQHGTDASGEIFPFRWPESDGHLFALQVAGAEVIDDRETGDVLPCAFGRNVFAAFADDDAELQLVIEFLAAVWGFDYSLVTDQRTRIGEVEDRRLVPFGRNFRAAFLAAGFHVLFEGVEIAERFWVQHGRQERGRSSQNFWIRCAIRLHGGEVGKRGFQRGRAITQVDPARRSLRGRRARSRSLCIDVDRGQSH